MEAHAPYFTICKVESNSPKKKSPLFDGKNIFPFKDKTILISFTFSPTVDYFDHFVVLL